MANGGPGSLKDACSVFKWWKKEESMVSVTNDEVVRARSGEHFRMTVVKALCFEGEEDARPDHVARDRDASSTQV